jgi:hypothetical protein
MKSLSAFLFFVTAVVNDFQVVLNLKPWVSENENVSLHNIILEMGCRKKIS